MVQRSTLSRGVVFEKDERGISETAAGINEVTIAKIIPDGKIEKSQAVMCHGAKSSNSKVDSASAPMTTV